MITILITITIIITIVLIMTIITTILITILKYDKWLQLSKGRPTLVLTPVVDKPVVSQSWC